MSHNTRLQPQKDIEDWYKRSDPWDYEHSPDDQARKDYMLKVLPEREYTRVLDIGCGNGFITQVLPGRVVLGCDVSKKAIHWAQQKVQSTDIREVRFFQSSIFDLLTQRIGTFDLIIITGVLYRQYIGSSNSLIHLIIDKLLCEGGILVSCHIKEWYICAFPFMLIDKFIYKYREYYHQLEVYQK